MKFRPEHTIHKSWLNRLLIELVDNPLLSQKLAFKGGTCAAMLGYLDRFSVDLDFDVLDNTIQQTLKNEFYSIFKKLDFSVEKQLDGTLFFQLKYPSSPGQRNTLKVSATDQVSPSNQYKVQYFPEIDRLMNAQTIESMFANKLVAPLDRYDQHQTVAGRDIYDIHHFFLKGYSYAPQVIKDRTMLELKDFFKSLITHIKNNISETIINEDLNLLLPKSQFQQIRKILLPETLHLLSLEQKNLAHSLPL
jgi:predicted nucleotidyltransferase component of viral defense system